MLFILKKIFNYIILFFFLPYLTNIISAQEYFNFGFEQLSPENIRPTRWNFKIKGNNTISIDSIIKYSGTYSLKLSGNEKSSYSIYSANIPTQLVQGKKITLKGFIKVENLIGEASLFCTVNGIKKRLSYVDNFGESIYGIKDWKEYSISSKIDKNAIQVELGGYMSGFGTTWFDSLSLIIEDTLIEDASSFTNEKDLNEFNQYLLTNISPINDDSSLVNFFHKALNKHPLKIIGIGETTHGSKESNLVRKDIVNTLLKYFNYDLIFLEAGVEDCFHLNNYVIQDGENIREILDKKVKFWTYNNLEFLEMIKQLKRIHNASDKNVNIKGIDISTGFIECLELLKNNASKKKKTKKQIEQLKTKYNLIFDKYGTLNKNHDYNQKINEMHDIIKNLKEELYPLKKQKDTRCEECLFLINSYLINSIRPTYLTRDALMYNNIERILKIKDRALLISHNEHVKKVGGRLGDYLHQNLKNQYLSIGFLFYDGTYNVIGPSGIIPLNATVPFEDTYEYLFNKIAKKESIWAVDLRNLKEKRKKKNLNLQRRIVGAIKPTKEFYYSNLVEDFDIIIFFKSSSPTTILR